MCMLFSSAMDCPTNTPSRARTPCSPKDHWPHTVANNQSNTLHSTISPMWPHTLIGGWSRVCSRKKKWKNEPVLESSEKETNRMSTSINDVAPPGPASSEQELLELEQKYCSWGDTVHYLDPPKFFERAEGHYLYDREGIPYLDLQMWYSAASFGYGNLRLNGALKNQVDKLPQLACQYLHSEKVELAAAIGRLNESKFGLQGRVHFNVGGAQAIEDSLKIVRNSPGKNHVFAFMGGYHGRTLGASAITSSYRYRRRFGHFSDRAHFVPFPYCFAVPTGRNPRTVDFTVSISSPGISKLNTTPFGIRKRANRSLQLSTSNRSRRREATLSRPLSIFRRSRKFSMSETSCWLTMKSRWASTGQGSSGPLRTSTLNPTLLSSARR